MSLPLRIYEGYIVILPKKYFTFGIITVRASRPSHRLSRAKRLFAPIFELWYGRETNDLPSSIVCGMYSSMNLSEKRNMWLVARMGCPSTARSTSVPRI